MAEQGLIMNLVMGTRDFLRDQIPREKSFKKFKLRFRASRTDNITYKNSKNVNEESSI